MNTASTETKSAKPAKPASVGFESIRQIIERARAAEARAKSRRRSRRGESVTASASTGAVGSIAKWLCGRSHEWVSGRSIIAGVTEPAPSSLCKKELWRPTGGVMA